MKKVRWQTIVTRPMTLLTQDFILTGVGKQLKKLWNASYDLGISFKNGSATVFEGLDSKKKLERIILNKHLRDKKILKKHLEKGEKTMKVLLETSRKLRKSRLNVSNKELYKFLVLYKKSFHKFAPYLFTVFPIETVLTEQLEKEVRLNEGHFRILTTVQKDSEFYLEQKDLLEIALDKLSGKNLGLALESHVNLFGYMGLTNDFRSSPWDKKHFEKNMLEFKTPQEDLKKLVSTREKELTTYKSFIKTLPKKTVKIAELLQDYMWFRNKRISVLKVAQYNLRSLFLEICRRFGLSFDDLIWYKVDEIEDLLKNNKKVKIALRKKQFRIELIDGKIRYFDKELGRKSADSKIVELKGMIASVGQAAGIARILSSSKEIEKVKEGDILVTAMTTPDFVTAMRRSAAIVTDEGGILCHAAIVSREFGIPCIVGTQIATQVLKDGDRVLVDAEKGVVRKL